ncbi:MAG: TonB family protein [Helicobacteraceae bacterium]|jgi:TonB family protein|nr:TonB family protein [Helicobacteraceae bacterium]
MIAAFFLSFKSLDRGYESDRLTLIPLSLFEERATIAAPIEPIVPAAASQATIGANDAPNTVEEQNASSALSLADLNAIFAPNPAAPQTPAMETLPKREAKTASDADLIDLYGLTIYDLSPREREFLEQNLNPIQVITQRYLWRRGYPSLAAMKSMQGEVVLAFTLQPNGDISTIEVIRSSGWSLLDDHAIDTIRVAYKDYPHPIESVRVRMRVIYRL